ncbi:hypothetical protein THAOC_17150 [Thalassiosira oceanica]|uniref:MCM AAA-lid domain-containing protein n=2 Tax=Thalassiosira oceanica TaxID=159749 RepID=K0SBD8_THAOC|nr:hypothetical protein THAOC_17150 [Thalassiosira oceanica]|eukprot:EJK62244.1 hypothetical protein THAOC_17150 [Thalassiosira oceanica]
MDILLGRELETLRDQLRLQQEERLADAEARGDEDDADQARDVLYLLPDALPRIQCRPFHLRSLSHMRSPRPRRDRHAPLHPGHGRADLACHTRPQGGLLPVRHLRPLGAGRHRPWQDRRADAVLVVPRPARLHPRPQPVLLQRQADGPGPGDARRGALGGDAREHSHIRVRRPGRRREAGGPGRGHRRLPRAGPTGQPQDHQGQVSLQDVRRLGTLPPCGQPRRRGVEGARGGRRRGDEEGEKRRRRRRQGERRERRDGPGGRDHARRALQPRADRRARGAVAEPGRVRPSDEGPRSVDMGDGGRQEGRAMHALRGEQPQGQAGDARAAEEPGEGAEGDDGGGRGRSRPDGRGRGRGGRRYREAEQEGRHKRTPRRRPGHVQEPAAGVRPQAQSARRLHVREGLERRRTHRERGARSGDEGARHGVGRARAVRPGDMLHRRVRQDVCHDTRDSARGHGAADCQHRQGGDHRNLKRENVSATHVRLLLFVCKYTHAIFSPLALFHPAKGRFWPAPTPRFDLIYLILDAPNVAQDRQLAQHLVGLYYETPNVVEPPLDHGLLRDYIAYARENIHPELSDLAVRELTSAYIEMRRGGATAGSGRGRTITATPRQLESLIRLSESLARMRFSRLVTKRDVSEAVRLMKVATQQAATDPRTGRIDMDMIATGRSRAEQEKQEGLMSSVRELLVERRGNRLGVADVRRQLSEVTNEQIEQEDIVEVLRTLDADGLVQYNERAQTVFVRAGVVG